ncbi:MAG: tetratricopeptide repeat protein [Treponema sp.]|jgi:tetratricopeptide (TPR) repeat protein|nr:tetratricopeptide repeat protein [Treponema sp.]
MKKNEKIEKVTFLEFIEKNRKGVFIFGAVLIALAIGAIALISVYDVLNKKAIEQIELLAVRFDDLRFNINDENYTDEVNTLLEELEAFGKNNFGIAAGRAFSYAGRIYSSREDWAACEESWLKASQKGNKTYLAPIALFNVAAAAEEQGKIEQAIEFLQKSVEHSFEFPAAPRAQFNIGRLNEQLGDNQAALAAYREVLTNWQNIPVWPDLARSAILRIEVEEVQ